MNEDYNFEIDNYREDELLNENEVDSLDIYEDIDYDGINDDFS